MPLSSGSAVAYPANAHFSIRRNLAFCHDNIIAQICEPFYSKFLLSFHYFCNYSRWTWGFLDLYIFQALETSWAAFLHIGPFLLSTCCILVPISSSSILFLHTFFISSSSQSHPGRFFKQLAPTTSCLSFIIWFAILNTYLSPSSVFNSLQTSLSVLSLLLPS